MQKDLNVVLWGTYDTGKPRTRILMQGLRETGISLTECHADIWSDVEDKSRLRGRLSWLKYVLYWLAAYPKLLFRYLFLPKHDVVIIGYWGQIDILLLYPLAQLRGVKIVWDPLLSLYNTLVEHRGWVTPKSLTARVLYGLEWLGCRCADLLVLNTSRGASYFVDKFGIPPQTTKQVFLGAETDIFCHRGEFLPQRNTQTPLKVMFYGTFLPAHSVSTIVAAARLPCDLSIEWLLVGQGQEGDCIAADLQANPVENLHWDHWVDYTKLPKLIAESDLCLGHFGDNEIAAWAIPNKAYQILATGTPFLTRESPGFRELLSKSPANAGNPEGVYLVPPKNPQAIVDAIVRFADDWPTLAGKRLHEDLIAEFDPAAFGRNYRSLLEALMRNEI